MAATAALRVFEHNALAYRRVWRGSVLVSFISPIFFLTAMGIGLGALINRRSGGVGGFPYRDFIAPGLLAATAMQTAAVEMTYPIMAKMVWWKTYDAILATPLEVRDLVLGELAWMTARIGLVCVIFFAVMWVVGATHSPLAPLVIVAGTLTGLSFTAPILAFTATQRGVGNGFAALTRFVVTPLFLFGGTFFPIDRLPAVLEAVAWLTPLAHGVALCRGLALGRISAGEALVHVAVPAAYVVAGAIVAYILMKRRLVA
jgi:lipooligosaccharide transport system permease protein